LEHQSKVGFLGADAAKLANALVGRVWDQKPEWFNGAYGQRPHKISVAAAALAHGVQLVTEDDPNRAGVLLALGAILSEVEKNESLYPFNGIDQKLLSYSVTAFSEGADIDSGLGKKPNKPISTVKSDRGEDDNASRKNAAAEFLDAQIAGGAMTQEQFDTICGTLSMCSMMTGNLQEAYEMVRGKPVPSGQFTQWLNEHPEGEQWRAMWVLVREGQPDSTYHPA
jgi:hypothetical protein